MSIFGPSTKDLYSYISRLTIQVAQLNSKVTELQKGQEMAALDTSKFTAQMAVITANVTKFVADQTKTLADLKALVPDNTAAQAAIDAATAQLFALGTTLGAADAAVIAADPIAPPAA